MKLERIPNMVKVIALILLLAGMWATLGCKGAPPEISLEPVPPVTPEEIEAPVSVGYGWSVKNEAAEAVAEAVSIIKERLGTESPDYVILFSTVGYDSEEVLRAVRQHLGSDCQIYGGTSCVGVLTKDGFHIGETGSLALLAISSPRISFGVGGADMKLLPAREAGNRAILTAMTNAKREGELPQLVLLTSSPGEEEEVLLGIEDVIGKDIPIIGGSSADNDISGQWKQFANDKVYSQGVTLTAIYTDLKIGWAYESGYLRSENEGIITKAESRIIYEIEHQPAAEIYNEWLGGALGEKLKTGGSILSETTFFPLAKVIRGRGGEVHYLSIHPLSINLPEKSLTMFANVEEGDELLLLRGNWELLLNWAQTTPRKALANLLREKASFGIFTYCGGTMLAIPEEERPKLPLLINGELKGVPFIGTFTFGEQGFLSGVGNRHGNLVNSMIVFSLGE